MVVVVVVVVIVFVVVWGWTVKWLQAVAYCPSWILGVMSRASRAIVRPDATANGDDRQ